MVSRDPWPILVHLLRPLCARRVTWARKELPIGDVPIDSSGDSIDLQMNRQVLIDWMVRRLVDLPEQQRLAVDFRYRWGWPYWAIAAGIGTSEPTARVHLTRGVRRLRQFAMTDSLASTAWNTAELVE